jgi:hypothetical protein
MRSVAKRCPLQSVANARPVMLFAGGAVLPAVVRRTLPAIAYAVLPGVAGAALPLVARVVLTLALGVSLAGSAAAQLPGPKVCDLDVLYITRTPKYPGYQPNYGVPGKDGQPLMTRKGDDGKPVELTTAELDAQQRWPKEGEPVTYAAVIENKGTADAPPFEWTWTLDGAEVSAGKTDKALLPGKRIELMFELPWKQARRELVFWADPMRRVRQFSYENDRRTLWTHAKLLICYADSETYASFAQNRNFLGTYSFEDWCQAHADWMNLLFTRSVYPETAPDGILDRVAVDFIGVLEDEQAHEARFHNSAALKEGWDGGWWFGRNKDCAQWAAAMDWGLIHEWGHQLGLTDLYALDVAPENNLVLDAGGTPLLLGQHSVFSGTMMHGHGPVVFAEDQALALNHQLWRRRGFYGDYYYNLAKENAVRVCDTAGQPVDGAALRIWQRHTDDGTLSGEPTFSGKTDGQGLYVLPNQPAPHIVTHGDAGGGYELHDNPFGLINVVGANGRLLVEIVARGQTEYAFLEIPQFNVAKARQGDARAVVTLATQLPVAGAAAAPPPPQVELTGTEAKLTLPGASAWVVWRADPGTCTWQRIGDAAGATYTDKLPRSGLYRYAAAVEQGGKLSARSEPVGVASLVEPWGLAVAADGTRYVRDKANGQTLMLRAGGSAVGFVGSVHWHFEGSVDHATDSKGLLYVAKWPDGYDPKRAWIRRIDPKGKGREHDRKDLAGGETASSEPGRFKEPMGIAVAADGRVVVADTGNNRVQILSPEGKVLSVVEGLTKPNKAVLVGGAPAAQAGGKSADAPAGERLVVCDTGAQRVVVLAPDGAQWKEAAVVSGFEEPIYACVGVNGDVWIADRGAGRVYAIDPQTWRKKEWSFPAAAAAKIEELRGIAFDATRGDLLYVDGKAKRVGAQHVVD